LHAKRAIVLNESREITHKREKKWKRKKAASTSPRKHDAFPNKTKKIRLEHNPRIHDQESTKSKRNTIDLKKMQIRNINKRREAPSKLKLEDFHQRLNHAKNKKFE
jgi:hypothetical protein